MSTRGRGGGQPAKGAELTDVVVVAVVVVAVVVVEVVHGFQSYTWGGTLSQWPLLVVL